ncbi:hypothetical protein PR262_08490 [Clostridioides difficile]|nr:hypothetical protein [Clostridioides difficile]HBH3439846.1 hypothetical protein [Clostridioides difficile]
MVTNERKQVTCIKYDIYLRVINILSNKIILQRQLVELVVALGIAKDEYEVMKVISELERAEIIKKIKYSRTSSKFILFKKYAIRYLGNAKKSNEVASLTVVNSNKRYVESIVRMKFILRIIIPSMKKRGIRISFDTLLSFIDSINCNLLYQCNNMSPYYNNLIEDKSLNVNIGELNSDFNILKVERKNQIANLKGLEKECNLSYRKNKEDYLYNSNIATLARKNIFIASIRTDRNSEYTVVKVYYFNLSKDKNSYLTVLNYCICYNVLKRLFGENIILEFTVITLSSLVKNSLIEDLNKKGVNPRTKEKRKESYFIELLRGNGLNEIDFEKIKMKIISFEIE